MAKRGKLVLRPLSVEGRIAIPIEMRRALGWETNDQIAVQLDGKVVRLWKPTISEP
ncbi:MAG TPA: hypothetical protein VM286_04360 [Candidatus Thermoplasmatota archaeon]|nr:hypothetical protein [Candidatus Thermoplasmatota archaeon]